MRYKDYEGPVEELVRMKMKEIEEKEQIRVLQLIKKYRRQNKAHLYFLCRQTSQMPHSRIDTGSKERYHRENKWRWRIGGKTYVDALRGRFFFFCGDYCDPCKVRNPENGF